MICGSSFVKFVVRVRSFFTELPAGSSVWGGRHVGAFRPPPRPHVVDSPKQNDLSTCALFNLIPSRSEGVRNTLFRKIVGGGSNVFRS